MNKSFYAKLRTSISGMKLLKCLQDPISLLFMFKRDEVSVLHCGAWYGEESVVYSRFGIRQQFWVEAQPDACQVLKKKFGPDSVFEGALSDTAGRFVNFLVTDNGLSSSLLEINKNNEWNLQTKEVIKVKTITINDVMNAIKARSGIHPNLLVLDLQGSELDALKGLRESESMFKYIICEVTDEPFYQNGASSDQIKNFLADFGFFEVWKFTHGSHGHGDALYVRGISIKQKTLYRCLLVAKKSITKLFPRP